MAGKSEETNGSAPTTEFARSIARSAAGGKEASSKPQSKPSLVDSKGDPIDRNDSPMADDRLKDLAAEMETLRLQLAEIAQTARQVATKKVDVTVADIEETLTRNVFASVGIAALAGYLWGRLR